MIRPRRKRGFYRALKRKEPWALSIQTHEELLEAMLFCRFSKELYTQILEPCGWTKLIGLSEILDKE